MSTQIVLKGQADLTSPEDADRLAAEVEMARHMAEILQRLYPGHRWATYASSRQGIVTVSIPDLMGPTLRYVIHADRMTDYNAEVRELRRAGGEILERFKLKRGSFVLHDFQDALQRRIKDKKTPMPE